MTKLAITIEGYTFDVELEPGPGTPGRACVRINGQPVEIQIPAGMRVEQPDWFLVDDQPYEIMIDPDLRWIRSAQGIYSLEIQDQEMPGPRPPAGDGRVKAPIPGQITQIIVGVGDEVAAGQPLLVLEAMKMENEIRSPRSGQVKLMNVAPGQRVSLNDLLVEIE